MLHCRLFISFFIRLHMTISFFFPAPLCSDVVDGQHPLTTLVQYRWLASCSLTPLSRSPSLFSLTSSHLVRRNDPGAPADQQCFLVRLCWPSVLASPIPRCHLSIMLIVICICVAVWFDKRVNGCIHTPCRGCLSCSLTRSPARSLARPPECLLAILSILSR